MTNAAKFNEVFRLFALRCKDGGRRMKLLIDFPKKDYKFIRDTYKETGLAFIPPAIKCECTEAVFNGTPYKERKTGKWVRQGGIHNMYTSYACSECRREIEMYYDFGNIPTDADVINEFPYCHCGVKMEVDE